MSRMRLLTAAVLAACLLTGCAESDFPAPVQTDYDESAVEEFLSEHSLTEREFRDEDEPAVTQPPYEDTVPRITVTSASETAAGTEEVTTELTTDTEPTGTTVTETETTAETTETTVRRPHQPEEAEENGVVPLYAQATVDRLLGTVLRASPDPASRRLTVIRKDTQVQITGYAEGVTLPTGTNRWLRAEYDGKTGFFSADDAVIVCDMQPQELSDTQCRALGRLLYPQAQRLMRAFRQEGGYPLLETAGPYDGGYRKLRPDMTMRELYARFYAYFTEESFRGSLDRYYKEANGALWVLTGTGHAEAVMQTALTDMTERHGGRITFSAQTDFYPDSYAVTGQPSQTDPFTLVFADGCWKIAALTVF